MIVIYAIFIAGNSPFTILMVLAQCIETGWTECYSVHRKPGTHTKPSVTFPSEEPAAAAAAFIRHAYIIGKRTWNEQNM